MEEEMKILKVKDLMQRMNIGRDRAYAIMKSTAFPSIQIGKTYFITLKDFNQWLDDYAGKEFVI